MKTTDDIIKGLQCCSGEDDCSRCPYLGMPCANDELEADALAYIRQMKVDHKAEIEEIIRVKNKEFGMLQERLRHLLQSDFIRSFDEIDHKTNTYRRNISEADSENTNNDAQWIKLDSIFKGMYKCSNCMEIVTMTGKALIENKLDNYCAHCGSKMRGRS